MSKDMAHRDLPLSIHPYGRPIYGSESKLPFRLPERIRLWLGWALAALIVCGLVVLLALPGN